MADTAGRTPAGAITARLKELAADQPHLLRIADSLTDLDTGNVWGWRINIRGIPPVIDQFDLTSIVGADSLGKLIAQLTSVEKLVGISIFPYGIINPELYQVAATYGNETLGG
jgi:hypothetical protein